MKPGETWRGEGLKGSMLRTDDLRDFSRNTCSIDEAKAPEQAWDSVQTGLDDEFYGRYTPKTYFTHHRAQLSHTPQLAPQAVARRAS